MCEIWLTAWTNAGYEYDIQEFHNWGNIDFGDFPDFDISISIVPPPVFTWTSFYASTELETLYIYFNGIVEAEYLPDYALTMNSLPRGLNFDSIFSIELHFYATLRMPFVCWSYGSLFNTMETSVYQSLLSPSNEVVDVRSPNFEIPDLRIFTPLQMVLNNWLESINWLSPEIRYKLQMQIAA